MIGEKFKIEVSLLSKFIKTKNSFNCYKIIEKLENCDLLEQENYEIDYVETKFSPISLKIYNDNETINLIDGRKLIRIFKREKIDGIDNIIRLLDEEEKKDEEISFLEKLLNEKIEITKKTVKATVIFKTGIAVSKKYFYSKEFEEKLKQIANKYDYNLYNHLLLISFYRLKKKGKPTISISRTGTFMMCSIENNSSLKEALRIINEIIERLYTQNN